MEPVTSYSADQLQQAFEVFNRVSEELDTSYRDLESRVSGLTDELAAARSARLRELSEKERLANRLASLVAALPGGVLIIDAGQIIRAANPEAVDLLSEPLIGEKLQAVFGRASEQGQRLPSSEMQLTSGRRLSIMSRPLDTAGEQVMLLTDVTELQLLQEQLERKKRLAALGEMAARLAHQIRTPLSAATLYLSQLSRQDLPAEQRRTISGRLTERLGHMSKLVDSMLSFVRGASPTRELVYIDEVLKSFDASLRPHLEKAGAALSIPQVDRTLAVMGDREELAGALSNLAMNALENAESTAPLKLDLWVGALNTRWLQLRISDNGPGVAEDILDRVFDPFFTTRTQGTGLGLAVVAMTVAQFGGEIAVRNNANGGAEFLITLPMAEPSAQNPLEAAASATILDGAA